MRHALVEKPAEHLRNALQLLSEVNAPPLEADAADTLAAALARLHRALDLLERR